MIRRAVPADAAAIALVEARASAHPWSPAQVAGSLALPTTLAWVVAAPEVRGHVLASAAGGTGEILTLAVDPDARRLGHARALLAAAAAAWQAGDVCEAFLEVRADNEAARALYAGAGWAPVAARKGYYGDGCDAIVYRWEPLRSPDGT